MRTAILLLLLTFPAFANESYDHLFQRWGAVYGTDWKLLKAVALTESNLDPMAVNPEESYGLMQLHCVSWPCREELKRFDGWPPESKERLMDADYSVMIAAQLLADNIKLFGIRRGIAQYNGGRCYKRMTERCWEYFRKVRENYRRT